ncbi:MAG: hypothetical protein JXC85_04120 [Candidatus Aenigmarchaeota archaeon]|nr:hypothetical protein [Candidatus Aenigmarchaeota archaeon]
MSVDTDRPGGSSDPDHFKPARLKRYVGKQVTVYMSKHDHFTDMLREGVYNFEVGGIPLCAGDRIKLSTPDGKTFDFRDLR